MANKQDFKKNQQPECGKTTGRLCSELFTSDSRYGENWAKGFLYEFHKEWSPIFPGIFKDWKKDKKTREISTSFINKYSEDLYIYIKDQILENERIYNDYISFDLKNSIKYMALRFIAGNDKDYLKIKRFINTKKRKSEPECGKGTNILCSQLFQQRYNIDRMKGLTIKFYDKYHEKYHEVFGSWPIDEKTGLINNVFLTDYASGLFEYIKIQIEKSEKSHKSYQIHNMTNLVYIKANSFIIDEFKNITRPRRLYVNNNLLESLRQYLNLPALTISDIKSMIENSDSEETKELKESFSKVPGLNKAWFKLEKYEHTGEKEIFMYIKEESIATLFDIATRGLAISGVRKSGHLIDSQPSQANNNFFLEPDQELNFKM